MFTRQWLIGVLLLVAGAVAAAPSAWGDVAEVDDAVENQQAFETLMRHAAERGDAARPFAEIVQGFALDDALQGQDYVRAPLDHDPDHEQLYASFSRFDCVTFVETVLALSETLANGEQQFKAYEAHLAALRYRGGEPGYCERLHYFTDWIQSNAAAGRVEDVTARVAGGDRVNLAFSIEPQGLNFLSRHVASVSPLASSSERLACVVQSEQRLTALMARNAEAVPGFAYIPKSRLAQIAGRLQGGDIVAWVADQPGLDVIHVGIVVQLAGRASVSFAHASLRTGGMALSQDLQAYAKSLGHQRGLIVLRPKAPLRR